MSVNDIITSGAKPLFFLDYFATSHLDVDLAEKVWAPLQFNAITSSPVVGLTVLLVQVIKGIVDGCQQSNCALLGGEVV